MRKVLIFAGITALLLALPARSPRRTGRSSAGRTAAASRRSQEPAGEVLVRRTRSRWSATLGDGIGSPVVARRPGLHHGDDRAADSSRVFCLDAATGKQLWKREFDTGKLPRITPPNSHASSTPAADGKRVYVYFSTLGLLAFDARDGEEAWRLPLPVPAYLMDWGAAASPIVYKDLVIFNQDDDLTPFLRRRRRRARARSAGRRRGPTCWPATPCRSSARPAAGPTSSSPAPAS